MYSNLLADLTTTTDVAILRQEIQDLQASLYAVKKGTFDEVLTNNVRRSVSQEIKREIEENKVTPEKYLEGLTAELDQLPSVQVSTAVEPSQGTLEKIHTWLNEQLGKHVLLDLRIQPNLLAGATVSAEGKYYDGSLQEHLDTIIEETVQKFHSVPTGTNQIATQTP